MKLISLAIISIVLLSQLINTKELNQTRNKKKLSKVNKSNKRQEKSLVASRLVNLNEPEFDSFNEQTLIEQLWTPNSAVNISVLLGQNVILPCAVRNIGSFKILWLRVKDGDVLAYDDMIITQDSRFSLTRKSVNESNLKIQNVKSIDSGEYACQINTQSLKAKLINLIIMTPPVFTDLETVNDEQLGQYYTNSALTGTAPSNLITKHASHMHHNHRHQKHPKSPQQSTKSINVIESKQISLECQAFGIPKPEINWYVKRYHSSVLTEYLLNSSKLVVNNVTRDQYDYFECEATNKIPPSVSKKFKINVLYKPELTVTPSKVFVNSKNLPVQVKFNCSVDSFPDSEIQWLFWNKPVDSLKKVKRHKKVFNRKLRRNNLNQADDDIDLDVNLILTNKDKYSIYVQLVNETFKVSSLVIDIENENDLGVYSCYANNSVGSKSSKFYIYGEKDSPESTTKTSATITAALNETAESANKILINNYQFVSSSKNENYDFKTLQNLNKKDLIIDDNFYLFSSSTPVSSFQFASTLLNSKKSNDLFDTIFKSSSNYSTFISSSSCSISHSKMFYFDILIAILTYFLLLTIF